jgi:hypothetical protein
VPRLVAGLADLVASIPQVVADGRARSGPFGRVIEDEGKVIDPKSYVVSSESKLVGPIGAL